MSGAAWRPALGAAVLALGGAGIWWALWKPAQPEPVPPHPSPVVLTSDAPAPSAGASAFATTPECGETIVATVCGRTVRCRKTGEDRALLRDGAPAGDETCFPALKQARATLLRAAARPLDGDVRREDPFARARRSGCPSLSLAERERAYVALRDRVGREGAARARRMTDAAARSEWTEIMLHRFDFVSVETSCAGRGSGAFLVKAQSDVGAPGVIPYLGIWRVAPPRPPEPRFERGESTLASFWGAGDLDGDGVEEIVARLFPAGGETTEGSALRYELIDSANDARVVLVERVAVVDRQIVDEPRVYGVKLLSGAALVVGDRLLHYRGGILHPAPAEARDELRAVEAHARARIEGALARLDAPAPATPGAPDRCADLQRLGWAVAFARELAATGQWEREGALADAAKLAGAEGCLADLVPR